MQSTGCLLRQTRRRLCRARSRIGRFAREASSTTSSGENSEVYSGTKDYRTKDDVIVEEVSTTSSSGEDSEVYSRTKDYLTNDGVVEGVWIFSRHGDRVPSRVLSPPHRRDEEAAFWMTKLPCPDSAAAYEAYSRRFPLEILANTNQGKFLDVSRNPFGFLTQDGLQQLKENGHRFFNRYNHHGHHMPEQAVWRWDVAQDFLSCYNISVYSTNYLRTVMSAQSFLDGLLGADCFVTSGCRKYDPTITKELRVPNHAWRRADFGVDALVKVHVRDTKHDPLNAFDRNPDLIADMVSEVMQSDDFQKKDSGAAPLAARLANILPGLVRKRSGGDFAHRSPSGINWVDASDHFVCRAAHGVELARFSDFEDDDRVEQTLTAMSHPTLAHLAWRFRKWYQHESLLAAIAAPPLREIADQLATTTTLGDRDRRPFVLFSCHDITILGLLYGIGAEFLAKELSSEWRFWPSYGSTLVFELVRLVDQPPDCTSDVSHVVRVLLNGTPVLSVDFEKANSSDDSNMHVGSGPERMLSLQDFENVVSRLEDAGGHDYESLLGYK